MSKFLDCLERISIGTPAPLGFGAGRAQKRPGLALVGLVSGDGSADHGALADLAPDAVLFSSAHDLAALKEVVRPLGEEVPWGLRVSSPTEEDTRGYEDGGCGLLAFSLVGTPVSAVASDNMARILCVGPDIELERLRAIDALPIDVLLLSTAELSAPWTLEDLAAIAGVSCRVDKYILVEVSQPPGAKDLVALRDAGVNGLVVDVGAVGSEALAELKTALLDMPRQSPKTKGRPAAMLSRSAFFPAQAPEQEEQQPEEDE